MGGGGGGGGGVPSDRRTCPRARSPPIGTAAALSAAFCRDSMEADRVECAEEGTLARSAALAAISPTIAAPPRIGLLRIAANVSSSGLGCLVLARSLTRRGLFEKSRTLPRRSTSPEGTRPLRHVVDGSTQTRAIRHLAVRIGRR